MNDAKTGIKEAAHTESVMNSIARALDELLEDEGGKKMGFMLMVFEFGKPGVANYVSNADREDMIKALREKADALEAGEVIPRVKDGMVH